MHYLSILLTSLTALTTITATPTNHPRWNFRVRGCDLSNVHLKDLPSGQDNVTVSPDATPTYVTVGVGVQNYTCQNNSYVSIGAVAKLFDISCLASNEIVFDNVQEFAFQIANSPIERILGKQYYGGSQIHALINHYFVQNPDGSGIAPRFDLAGTDRFTTLKKTGDIPSPQGKENVDWLELSEVAGDLSNVVYRTDTVQGQPPSSCEDGSPVISINYAAKYWFFDSV